MDTHRVPYRLGLLLALAVVSSQGCELPSGEHGKTLLTLSFTQADPIIIGDTSVLKVEAQDPAGRVVVDPPLTWNLPPWGLPPENVLHVGAGQITILEQQPGILQVEVQVRQGDPWFESDKLTAAIPVRYSPITVNFVGVGSDTVLTARGLFYLRASAVDQRGDTINDQEFVVTPQGRSVEVEGTDPDGHMSLFATGFGPDTVTVTNTACPNPCGDTVVVDVEPVPAQIFFPRQSYWAFSYWANSLGMPFEIPAMVQDRNAYEIPGIPITWELTDSSGILSVVDSTSGTFVANMNDTTTVWARVGDITDWRKVNVHQEVARFEVDVPPYVAGAGTDVLARFRGWDPGGTPIDSLLDVAQSWSIPEPSIANVVDAPGGTDHTASLRTQGYGVTSVDLTLSQCGPDDRTCWDASEQAPLHVIPEPDSVVAYPEAGGTILSGIGSTATWLGDIYLPGETISAVPLIWTSLDPDVATIDVDGLVTAVSAGTARIVGTMGAAADTTVVTVSG